MQTLYEVWIFEREKMQEIKKKIIISLIKECNNHLQKYSNRKMSLKELDELCCIENK